jgi:hypothetical protein
MRFTSVLLASGLLAAPVAAQTPDRAVPGGVQAAPGAIRE